MSIFPPQFTLAQPLSKAERASATEQQAQQQYIIPAQQDPALVELAGTAFTPNQGSDSTIQVPLLGLGRERLEQAAASGANWPAWMTPWTDGLTPPGWGKAHGPKL